ncbi:HNH endonuclease [Ralstonia phage RSP15]|uniref:HNH endonuclease n=1 Tax=Ralstonia phage RSP15 TaxID=1785960 RepID=UPI00074D463F|nr:HNH endonuclease [Ralstonia phage RSP15]BAU40062.1 HNH endonuclease [Ralstonia phage RSP15]
MDIEIWKDVVGFEDRYQISSFGNLYSKKSQRILARVINNGYYTHSIRIGGKNGKSKLLRIHRLVAEAFIPNPENKPFVNHIDGNKLNPHVWNLEWATCSENTQHAFDNGLIVNAKGSESKLASFSEHDLLFIRTNAKQNGGSMSQRDLGKYFGVNHVTVGRVLREQRY